MPRILLSCAFLILAACGGGARPESASPDQVGPPAQAKLRAGEIALRDLPPEARAMLELIKMGGPFRYAQDGTVFANREGRLPAKLRGYYHEYTVRTPGAQDRGARRIIAGSTGEYYYTDDHYQSFKRIRE
jgi:ribonuclease T1